MDNLALHAVTLELAGRLTGRRIDRVESPLEHYYLFRPDPPGEPFLLSVHPDCGGIFPVDRPPPRRPPATGSFAALMHRVLAGSRIETVRKRFPERVVELRFTGGRWTGGPGVAVLQGEFLGRSANLILVDPRGRVAGAARRLRSAFRSQAPGERYAPPPVPAGPAPEEPGGWRSLLDASGSPGPRGILRRLAPSLEAAIPPEMPEPEIRRWLDATLARFSGGRFEPVLCFGSDSEPEPGDPIDRSRVILSPVPPPACPGRRPVRYDDLPAAAGALLSLLLRHHRFAADRIAMRRAAAREAKRLERLRGELEGDLERVRDPERLRIAAESLLAGLTSAEVEGKVVRVANPYDRERGTVEVELPDPGRGLAENAGLLFHRYRRACRGAVEAGRRRAAIGPRAAAVAGLARRAGACRTDAELAAVEAELESLGILRPPVRKGRTAPRRREFRRFRRHASPDGYTLYVGRNAAENDELTFRIASEWDLWLHAAGVAGSHVLVRNPGREKELPPATLRFAAAAAAWHSAARGETGVEVHYAFRRQLRRGKRPGQVLLKRHRTIRVAPADPSL